MRRQPCFGLVPGLLVLAGCGGSVDVTGHYVSLSCDTLPDSSGSTFYLKRDLLLRSDGSWRLQATVFGDGACMFSAFDMSQEGSYSVGADASAGASELDLHLQKEVFTARTPPMADLFTMKKCGSGAWKTDQPQEVGQTGCLSIAKKISQCPTLYDVVKLDGNKLYLGERMDVCTAKDRPMALGKSPMAKQ